jgi:hypothetical protein
MLKDKHFLLTVSDHGVSILPFNGEANSVENDASKDIPVESEITIPRWNHWRSRKLTRLWYATLLGMNIEPTAKARAALRTHKPELYQEYKDRLDIAKTLIGYELEMYEDHMLEGEGAGEKYVMLTEYFDFAKSQSWGNLESMYEGLKLGTSPPVLKTSQRKVNNYLSLLDTIFQNFTADYLNSKNERSPAAVINWLAEKDAECPIEEPTLRMWLNEMNGLEKKKKLKNK